MVLSIGGAIAAAALSGAPAASAATPSWHPVLSVPGGGVTEALVATGKTSGWAFLGNGAAYQRVGATTWKKVAFPSNGGYVNTAAASSPSNVWAAFSSTAGGGSQVDRWNGRQWSVAKSFPGSVSSLSVLGPDDVWAFGSGGVSHFNGRGWAQVSAAAQSGGSATSDRDVWAISGSTQLAHYDGRKWTETSVAGLFPAVSGHHVAPALTGVLALAPNNVFATGVGWGDVGGGAAVVLHFNGHAWSLAANGPADIIGSGSSLASDGRGGLWMTSDTHENYEVLLHYSAGQIVNANEPFRSVASIPGTAEALGGNASPVATMPTVYQYS